MHQELVVAFGVTLTPWKIIGLTGALMFTARWFVQMYFTRKLKRVTMPMGFWYLSVAGSLMTLAYFIWGKNDSVGIIQNAFPMFVALYNVYINVRHRNGRSPGFPAPAAPEGQRAHGPGPDFKADPRGD